LGHLVESVKHWSDSCQEFVNFKYPDSCTKRAGRPRSNWIDTVSRDLKSIGMAWEDAEQAAVDREDWRGRVAQCVFDTGTG